MDPKFVKYYNNHYRIYEEDYTLLYSYLLDYRKCVLININEDEIFGLKFDECDLNPEMLPESIKLLDLSQYNENLSTPKIVINQQFLNNLPLSLRKLILPKNNPLEKKLVFPEHLEEIYNLNSEDFARKHVKLPKKLNKLRIYNFRDMYGVDFEENIQFDTLELVGDIHLIKYQPLTQIKNLKIYGQGNKLQFYKKLPNNITSLFIFHSFEGEEINCKFFPDNLEELILCNNLSFNNLNYLSRLKIKIFDIKELKKSLDLTNRHILDMDNLLLSVPLIEELRINYLDLYNFLRDNNLDFFSNLQKLTISSNNDTFISSSQSKLNTEVILFMEKLTKIRDNLPRTVNHLTLIALPPKIFEEFEFIDKGMVSFGKRKIITSIVIE